MHSVLSLKVSILLASKWTSIFAAPTPQGISHGPPDTTIDGPPDAHGSLRGSEELLGYSPANKLHNEPATVPPSDFQLAPGQTESAELGLYLDISHIQNPQPIRGYSDEAPTDPGPRNEPIDRQNSDTFIPPASDNGDFAQAKWPMGLSHNRHGVGDSGWARQQNTDNLPISDEFAGVNMHLEPWAHREMHWHKAGEWALVLNGSVRIAAMDEEGHSFIDDVEAGDLWFFPPGIPHSIQAHENGVEFLLVFDQGDFTEEGTNLVTQTFSKNPSSVNAKDLRVNVSVLDTIPQDQLFIFNGSPFPHNISNPTQNITGPAGAIPREFTYSYHSSKQKPYEVPGGSIKIIDPKTFPIAAGFSAAIVTVKPGAMREMHWHPTADEWSFFIAGRARLTAYNAPDSSRTFDFEAGDVGYVEVPQSHYIENTGDTDLVYLEMLKAPVFSDISVAQWLGLTPRNVVRDHLGFSDDTLDRLPQIKPYILPGNPDLLTTDFRTEIE